MIIARIALLLLASTTLLIGKDIYISSSIGNDNNDGSISKPLKTISSMPKEDANIFLKRGDVFFESISNIKNININTYATGAKPILCALIILKDNNSWLKLPNNLWRIDLQNNNNFVGYNFTTQQNLIGGVLDIKKDKLYAHRVDSIDKLNAEFDFCVSDNYLYFKSEKKPAEFIENVALILNQKAISNIENSSIKNILIKGFGDDAIYNCKNSLFENIDIDTIRGNAFTIFDSKNSIKNCKITRTFGTAFSIENLNKNEISDIEVTNNSIFRCRQALSIQKNENSNFNNISFKNNKCFDIGENDFNSPSIEDCNLLIKNINKDDNIDIKENIFWGSSIIYTNSDSDSINILQNRFYVYENQFLYFNENQPNNILWGDKKSNINALEKIFKNDTNTISIVSKDNKNLRAEILEESFSEHKTEIIQKTQEKYRRDSFYRK